MYNGNIQVELAELQYSSDIPPWLAPPHQVNWPMSNFGNSFAPNAPVSHPTAPLLTNPDSSRALTQQCIRPVMASR